MKINENWRTAQDLNTSPQWHHARTSLRPCDLARAGFTRYLSVNISHSAIKTSSHAKLSEL